MKKILYLLLLTPIIYLASCSKSSVNPEVENLYGCTDTLAINFDALATVNDSSCIYPLAGGDTLYGCTDTLAINFDALGDFYQGGIIFYLDGNGGGLICGRDLGSSNWGCFSTEAFSTGKAIGTGEENTSTIIFKCSEPETAAEMCYNSSEEGYYDWFLPSRDELYEMYLNKDIISGGGGGDYGFDPTQSYWSSSTYDPNYINSLWSYNQSFGTIDANGCYVPLLNASPGWNERGLPGWVRAIRAF